MKRITQFGLLASGVLLFASLGNSQAVLKNNKGQASSCGGSATCATAAFANPLTSGSVIFACALEPDATVTITETDTAGNTYNDSGAGTVVFNGSGNSIKCFCATNSHTTASNVVTANDAGNIDLYWNVAAEFTGVPNACTADKTATNANATNTIASNGITTGSVTPSTSGDLILGYVGTANVDPTAGTSPNSFTGLSPAGPMLEYLVYNSTSPINPTASDSNTSDPYGGITLAYGGTPTASIPAFNFAGGTYGVHLSVTLTAASGGVICYNTSGSPATNGTTGCTTGTLYTGAITVSSTETLYAVAGGTGYLDSAVNSQAYTIAATTLTTITGSGSITGSGVLQ